jgi:hypothetical protein
LLKGTTWKELNLHLDVEVTCSVHRWYWLLYDKRLLDTNDTVEVIRIVKKWVNSFTNTKDSLTWHPYNVSERISSFCTFLLYKTSYDKLNKVVNGDLQLKSFFETSVYHLSNHLEYYPGGVTYNHVINDIKGILTAAIICKDDKLVEDAASLLFQELEIVIGKTGDLREGSSHYQFISTRWICELEYLFLEAGYTKLKERISEYSRAMLNVCAFYLVHDKETDSFHIPLIGDVSPDFDPDWIVDYFTEINYNKDSSRSYGSFIINKLGYSDFINNSPVANKKIIRTKEMIRISVYDLDIFISHSQKNSFFPGHAHDDFGNYVFFINGKECIGDQGRKDYMQDIESENYVISQAHNVITIDDFPITIRESNRYYLPRYYQKSNVNVTISDENDIITISVSTDAVKRIKSKKIDLFERTFEIKNGEIAVTDLVNGDGTVTITGQVILHPSCVVETNTHEIKRIKQNENWIVLKEIKGIPEVKPIQYSQRYGSTSPSVKFVYSFDGGTLPLTHKITYKIN